MVFSFRFVANTLVNFLTIGAVSGACFWAFGSIPAITLFAFVPNVYAQIALDSLVLSLIQVWDRRGDPSMEGALVYLLWVLPMSIKGFAALTTVLFFDQKVVRPEVKNLAYKVYRARSKRERPSATDRDGYFSEGGAGSVVRNNKSDYVI